MSEKAPGLILSVRVAPELLADLDRLADKAGITRSRLTANLLEVAVGEAKIYEKTGILYLAMLLQDAQENIKKCIMKGNEKALTA